MRFLGRQIDINCDMGEGFSKQDQILMPYIDSANICCGLHAGGPNVLQQTIELALEHQVKIGAHPGFNDRTHFGRKEMTLTRSELIALIRYQVYACEGLVHSAGSSLNHIKLHGALYNMSCKYEITAKQVCDALTPWKSVPLVTLFESKLWFEAIKRGFTVYAEAFIDRRYQNECSLMPRQRSGSVIDSDKQAFDQLQQMVSTNTVTTQEGEKKLLANTYCIHGDNHAAIDILQYIHQHA